MQAEQGSKPRHKCDYSPAWSGRPTRAMSSAQVHLLRETIVALVRLDGPDLNARQLAVFLMCYLDAVPHTVRDLAAALSVPKPSITRAIDRLEEFSLVRRQLDQMDRRSVLVMRTMQGSTFMNTIRQVMAAVEVPPPSLHPSKKPPSIKRS
jgi:DNA-binding MarR family transcriptional regulator